LRSSDGSSAVGAGPRARLRPCASAAACRNAPDAARGRPPPKPPKPPKPSVARSGRRQRQPLPPPGTGVQQCTAVRTQAAAEQATNAP
jgi:hypothetical protein